MIQSNIFIDKNKLMQLTDNGKKIYEFFFPDLEMHDTNTFKRTLNPFYEDSNPSLSIYKVKYCWMHKDFGDEDFPGNALDMAALFYKLTSKENFAKLLHLIATDLKLDLKLVQKDVDKRVYDDGYSFDGDRFNDKEGLAVALNYFSDYGILEEVLKRFCVRAIKHLWTIDKSGKPKQQIFPKDEVVIAYLDVNHSKLYRPHAEKQYKFRYLGSKPENFMFGYGQILTNIHRTKNCDRGTLIITGGEKDVLTLVSLGYDAISLNSETAKVPKILFEGLFHCYTKIVMLYDLDETGQRNSTQLAYEHKLSLCLLPEDLITLGGKDVSDYIKLGMSTENLKQLIDNSPLYDGEAPAAETRVPQKALHQSKHEAESSVDSTLLPDMVYQLLPETLQMICRKFSDRRERDVCLLSCLTVLSSCFPTSKGIYDDRTIGCNINLFISAPASAGKGIMTWSKILGNPIHKHLKHEFEKIWNQYEQDLDSYNENKRNGNLTHKPEMPKHGRLFIPANSSCSSIIEYLDANQNFGIIFDNEGDTLSSIVKNEWGDFSNVIKKSFHHEGVSMSRRTNKEHLEVENPHLSILLSGTPNQITKLVHSVENGMFSRFVFYDFNNGIEWKDKFGKGEESLEEFFHSFGENILKYWIHGKKNHDVTYILNDLQIEEAILYFTKKLKNMHSAFGDDIVGSVKRTCLVFYRISIILAALNNYQIMNLSVNTFEKKMSVKEEYSKCAFLIVDTLLGHLETVFARIQKTSMIGQLKFTQQSLYNSLSNAFSWKEFLAVADGLGIKNAAAQKYRKDLMDMKLIVSEEHGKYKKL